MASFRIYNSSLCPDLWDKDVHLDPRIRVNLLRMAYDFYKKTKLVAPIVDIYLMGSITNYNWTPESDIDVHILIDYNKLQMPLETASKVIKTASSNWNTEHEITIKNRKVEMNFQDSNDKKPHVMSIYSLIKDQWLKPPVPRSVKFDKFIIRNKYEGMKKYIEDAIRSDNIEIMKNAKDYLDSFRQYGLDTSGELSLENIIFKILRARGIIKLLKDTIKSKYDDEMTINECINENNEIFYLSYGHDNPKDHCWVWDGNRVLSKQGGYHDDDFPNSRKKYNFCGRYDVDKNVISIVFGNNERNKLGMKDPTEDDVPQYLYQKLMDKFGSLDKEKPRIVVFENINETTYHDNLSDDEKLQDAERYFSIGHGDEEDGEPEDYVWIWDGNNILSRQGGTHSSNFGFSRKDYNFSGRYDPDKNIISIVFPDKELRKLENRKPTEDDIPQYLYQKLIDKYSSTCNWKSKPRFSIFEVTMKDLKSRYPYPTIPRTSSGKVDFSKMTLDNLQSLKNKGSRIWNDMSWRENSSDKELRDFLLYYYKINQEIKRRLKYINKPVNESCVGEGVGYGNPNKDRLHIPGERWRIKWGNTKTPLMKENGEPATELDKHFIYMDNIKEKLDIAKQEALELQSDPNEKESIKNGHGKYVGSCGHVIKCCRCPKNHHIIKVNAPCEECLSNGQIKETSKNSNTKNKLPIGNCKSDEIVDYIFGSVSEFARQVEKHGNEFVYGNIIVKYDPETDIHSFYYK